MSLFPSSLLRALALLLVLAGVLRAQDDDKTLRVFIFAGQSNMVGSDSHAEDIARFPPFVGLEKPQTDVKFSYCIGREDKLESKGWVDLAPVDGVVGPELSFARELTQNLEAPIAILKIAAGGTHLGGDWNPDQPSGFKLYPLALDWIRKALADLDRRRIAYRIEGFMWHQGENDMFEEGYEASYGKNLANFIAHWRRDLGQPKLRFYIGELCTKTVWGMDMRPHMYAISLGQREVTDADPLAEYIPTSHDAVEIGGGAGLHYHYGTLGQLEHGVNYADAYLRDLGKRKQPVRALVPWPYAKGSPVKLFILAGHRNMERERAFVQELKAQKGGAALRKDNPRIAFEYSLGGGFKLSDGWEPLGPAGAYDTFGPELSFGAALSRKLPGNIAIAKFTHSGSQILDWTPEGSEAKSRNLYPSFLAFVQQARKELVERGQAVELAGIFYHLGENDMSFAPHRKQAVERLASIIAQSRKDLGLPELAWFVSQQRPTDDESVNSIDVTAELKQLAAADPHLTRVEAFGVPGQEQQLVITTPGIVALGELLASSYLKQK
ncbi:MAG: hypothetical protein IPJ19_03565 [Planctomycetes bacterium]|nr:hypothetical protein [Planctomycetota bacterium]